MKSENSTFFDQLRDEHRAILETLMDVRKMGVHTMEGRNALTSSKDLLCHHFKKEDELLYPVLKKAAGPDKDKQKIIKAFVEEMKQVTRQCEHFFNTYSTSGGGLEFLKDFGHMYSQLENRLQKEERILFSIQ